MSDNPFSEGSDSKAKPNSEESAEAARDFAETSREDGESKLTVRVSTGLYERFKRRFVCKKTIYAVCVNV